MPQQIIRKIHLCEVLLLASLMVDTQAAPMSVSSVLNSLPPQELAEHIKLSEEQNRQPKIDNQDLSIQVQHELGPQYNVECQPEHLKALNTDLQSSSQRSSVTKSENLASLNNQKGKQEFKLSNQKNSSGQSGKHHLKKRSSNVSVANSLSALTDSLAEGYRRLIAAEREDLRQRMLKVGKRSFDAAVSKPNAEFPVDPNTMTLFQAMLAAPDLI